MSFQTSLGVCLIPMSLTPLPLRTLLLYLMVSWNISLPPLGNIIINYNMEKVIPTSLNYADIKPEAIENSVKLVRFTPTANVTNSKPNDVVRFNIQGNGFLDPRSAYIVLDVDFLLQNVNDFSLEDPAKSKTGSIANSGKTLIQAAKCLDRSAHSFFERFILRS